MALRSDRDALLAIWRALATGGDGDGWRTIPLGTVAGARVLAAKRFPGGLETLLIGFLVGTVPPDRALPQAKGFNSSRIRLEVDGSECVWLAVSRSASGGLEMFATMASDVLSLLDGRPPGPDGNLPSVVIARIVAWQRFMERGNSSLLSPEEEVGLFGELVVLREILTAAGDPAGVVESWVGPRDGLHDFAIGDGALEVKATVADVGFAARIAGLDQLDTTAVEPLYLIAVRLRFDAAGWTLGDMVDVIRGALSCDRAAIDVFGERLLWSGVRSDDLDKYTRRIVVGPITVHKVDGNFPRLVRANTPPAIIKVTYTMDLDMVPSSGLSIQQAFATLGTYADDA